MPAPEPGTVWLEEIEPGRVVAMIVRYGWSGKAGNRAKRARAILGRYLHGKWRCSWCREELDIIKRADAKYCCEGCRKAAARRRRAERLSTGAMDK